MDKLLKLVVKNEERLSELLSEEDRAVFQKFKDSQNELSSVNECEAFALGFRLGGRFVLEIMGDMGLSGSK